MIYRSMGVEGLNVVWGSRTHVFEVSCLHTLIYTVTATMGEDGFVVVCVCSLTALL